MKTGNPQRVICAVVLLNSNNDALLQLRDEKEGLSASGLWVFPGGHIDPEEDIFSCARREFLEETAYQCDDLKWLMSINDAFISPIPALVHIFWDSYDGLKTYICLEGQKLEFVSRQKAREINMPDYLISIWDLAILAAKSRATYSFPINSSKNG